MSQVISRMRKGRKHSMCESEEACLGNLKKF